MGSDILQGWPSESVAASGGDLDGSTAQTFTFSQLMARVFVQSHPDYLGLLYVKINSTTVSETDWDFIVQPGVPLVLDLPRVRTISILGTAAATYGTDFNCNGMH